MFSIWLLSGIVVIALGLYLEPKVKSLCDDDASLSKCIFEWNALVIILAIWPGLNLIVAVITIFIIMVYRLAELKVIDDIVLIRTIFKRVKEKLFK